MFWLPPVRFSTTTGWLHTEPKPCAMLRAMVSGEPPGVSGTMIFTGRSGNPWARPTDEKRNRRRPASQWAIGESPMVARQHAHRSANGYLQAFLAGLGWATPQIE